MNVTRRTVAGCGLLAALFSAVLAGSSAGQQPKDDQPAPTPLFPGTGTQLFRGLFHYYGIEPLRSPRDVTVDNSRDTIVVVLLRRDDNTRGSVEELFSSTTAAVLRGGGSLLIATDRTGRTSPFFPAEVKTEVEVSLPVYAPKAGLDDDPARPFVTARYPSGIQLLTWQSNNRPKGTEWTLFEGRTHVAVNGGSALRVTTPSSPYVEHSLAGFPDGSRFGSAAGVPFDRSKYSFAVGGSGVMPGQPPFRSLVLGDPDVFSNGLIAAADPTGRPRTDNLAFANTVVQWLRGPEDAPRTRCLFVDSGRVVSRFDEVKYVAAAPGVPPIPVPDLTAPETQAKLADAANRYIAEREDADAFNHALAGSDQKYVRTARVLAVAAAVVALLCLLLRAARGRHHPDLPPIPTDTGRVAGSAPPGSVARRREEVLQHGDYAEYVREYLRDLFAARGLPAPPNGTAPKDLPDVRVLGPDAKALKAHLRILWEVAYGPSKPVPYSRWKELEPMIDAVRRAADEGRWQFATPGGAA